MVLRMNLQKNKNSKFAKTKKLFNKKDDFAKNFLGNVNYELEICLNRYGANRASTFSFI